MAETFSGFSNIQRKATQQAERQRATARERGTTNTSRRTTTDTTQYGELRGTAKQERADGSVVYYKDGKIIAEFNPQGIRVARVGISTQTPSKSGRIDTITAPIILQQRYKEALTNYNRELARLEKLRQEKIRGETLRGAAMSRSIIGLKIQDVINRESIKKLTGPYSDDYKERLLKELDLKLQNQIRSVALLSKKLSNVRKISQLNPKERKQLEKLTTKITRVETERTKLAAKQKATIEKVKKSLLVKAGGGFVKEDSYLGRAVRELPAQALNAFYNLAPSLYKSALEVDAFFALARYSPKVVNKKDFRQDSVQNFKKTGKAIIEAYDPRNPANLFNIILTATAITSLGYAKVNKAIFKKQMSQAKITNGKVTVYGPRSKTPTYIVKGNLKLPEVTYLGRKIPSRTVPFRTTQQISRAAYKSQSFKLQGATNYVLTKTRLGLKGLKIKKVFVNVDKKVLFKGRGTSKPIAPKKYLTKQKVTLKSGARKTVVKSRGVISKKKITKLTNKETQQVLTKLKKVQSTDKVVRLKFKAEYAQLPRTTVLRITRNNINSLLRSLKKGISKKSLSIAKTNLRTLKTFLKDYFKARGSMLKDKKGTFYLTREGGPRLGSKPPARDFSKIDSLLKKVEQLDKARKTPIAKKTPSLRSKGVAKPKARGSQQLPYRIKNFDPSLIFKGYKLIAKPLLFNKIIPIALMVSPTVPGVLGLTQTPSVPKPSSKPTSPTKPVARAGTGTDTTPTPKEEPPVDPKEIVTQLLGTSIITNRFLPFNAGLPITSISGAGRIYSLPLRSLLKAERYRYNADLYSKIYGLKASKSDRANLLRAGRVFTGLEIRKIV